MVSAIETAVKMDLKWSTHLRGSYRMARTIDLVVRLASYGVSSGTIAHFIPSAHPRAIRRIVQEARLEAPRLVSGEPPIPLRGARHTTSTWWFDEDPLRYVECTLLIQILQAAKSQIPNQNDLDDLDRVETYLSVYDAYLLLRGKEPHTAVIPMSKFLAATRMVGALMMLRVCANPRCRTEYLGPAQSARKYCPTCLKTSEVFCFHCGQPHRDKNGNTIVLKNVGDAPHVGRCCRRRRPQAWLGAAW